MQVGQIYVRGHLFWSDTHTQTEAEYWPSLGASGLIRVGSAGRREAGLLAAGWVSQSLTCERIVVPNSESENKKKQGLGNRFTEIDQIHKLLVKSRFETILGDVQTVPGMSLHRQ